MKGLAILVLFVAALVACDKKGEPAPETQQSAEAASVPTRPDKADPADWCGGHDLPESMCTKCNPELTEKFKAAGDWCAEHELPESVCPKCNPMEPPSAAGAKPAARVGDPSDWCGGHGLPESMCTKCNPELTEKFKAAGDWCAAHELPESACPKCNPMEPPPKPGAAKQARVGDPADWCGGHGLPESMCTKCNPELTEKFKAAGDWCAAHELPESACPKCNPMEPPPKPDEHGAADPADWCKGHGLPESMCTKCHPELAQKFQAAGDWCAEHGYPESACPKCNPLDAPKQGLPKGTVVRLKKDDHEKTVGIEVAEAKVTPVGLGVQAPARVEFDQNKVAAVRSPIAGIVREVLVDLGDPVEAGTPMFVLTSAEVGDLQAQIQSAREAVETAKANLARQQRLHADGIAAARKVEVARQEVEAARSRLSSLKSSLRLAGAGSGSSTGRFTIKAPTSGTVVERPAVVGTSADESTPLATVADASAMWAIVDVPEREAHLVAVGQPVTLKVDGVKELTFEGQVTWLSPVVDPRTRTVKARAEIPNPKGLLRANQYATAEIGITSAQSGVVVPRDAIQRLDEEAVVFVRKTSGLYEPRAVEVGRTSGELVQVRGPLKAGEPVVTTGAFLLKTELKRDSIGAGCCEVPEN